MTFLSSRPDRATTSHGPKRSRAIRRPPDRRTPGTRRLPLVRADAGALVLDGHVRPELLSADTLHSQQRLQRAACVGTQHHGLLSRRRRRVHGDAVLPTGHAPFVDSISCDDTHWCAALTIDSLECTHGFAPCNTNCEEPVNFAFIQRDGVPAGPPSPQKYKPVDIHPQRPDPADEPGRQDHRPHVRCASAPGRWAKAFEVVVKDLTTGQSGWMQASAANGFANTSIVDCSGTPFNFQPEYSTAAEGQHHSLGGPADERQHGVRDRSLRAVHQHQPARDFWLCAGVKDTFWNNCHGPYENAGPPDKPDPGGVRRSASRRATRTGCFSATGHHDGVRGQLLPER